MFDLQGLNIYLVGMMGAGKSTIGKLLADRLGYSFIDTDTTIEQAAGQSIPDIFQSTGEAEFRQIESQILGEIAAYTRLVVATGGGIVIKKENWSHLQQGLVIWLDVPIAVLLERITQDTENIRPLLQTPDPLATLEQLFTSRRDRYAEADLHIEIAANQPPTAIVEQILTAIPTVLRATETEIDN
jgi:shikimate kinase